MKKIISHVQFIWNCMNDWTGSRWGDCDVIWSYQKSWRWNKKNNKVNNSLSYRCFAGIKRATNKKNLKKIVWFNSARSVMSSFSGERSEFQNLYNKTLNLELIEKTTEKSEELILKPIKQTQNGNNPLKLPQFTLTKNSRRTNFKLSSLKQGGIVKIVRTAQNWI